MRCGHPPGSPSRRGRCSSARSSQPVHQTHSNVAESRVSSAPRGSRGSGVRRRLRSGAVRQGALRKPNRDSTPSTSTSSKGRAVQLLIMRDVSLAVARSSRSTLLRPMTGETGQGSAPRARQAGHVQPRTARQPNTHCTSRDSRHPARARLRRRNPARLPLQAPRCQRGALGRRPAPARSRARRSSGPSGSRSAWASRSAPGCCTSRRWPSRRSRSSRPCSPPASCARRDGRADLRLQGRPAPVGRRRDDRRRPAAARRHAARRQRRALAPTRSPA